ncbi:transposase [Micromonospora vinacea]|uniref:transposase n=1 Tax=Micromonospora vinacea TaxID=709878 RepID=UPI00345199A6
MSGLPGAWPGSNGAATPGSVRDVGRELGVNHETLRNWVDRVRQERDGGRPSDLAAAPEHFPA